MKKCPFCAEFIQDDAIKCRYCGEFLTSDTGAVEKELKLFSVYRRGSSSLLLSVYRENPDQAIDTVYNDSIKHGVAINRDELYVKEVGKRDRQGKFTCPKCKSLKTECQKDIHWLFVVLTLGLALLIFWPFLPYNCKCNDCGYKWRP